MNSVEIDFIKGNQLYQSWQIREFGNLSDLTKKKQLERVSIS